MPSVTILNFVVWFHMTNQNYHLMKKSVNVPNFGDLNIFGCWFYIRPPGIRRNKMNNHVKKEGLLDIHPPPFRYIIGIWTLS